MTAIPPEWTDKALDVFDRHPWQSNEDLARAVLAAVADDLRPTVDRDQLAEPFGDVPQEVIDARRALRALRLEVPAEIADDVAHRVESAFAALDVQDAAVVAARTRREVLVQAADEMEAVIADGDVAEVAAPVPGEVGRSAVVAKRDALYEEPATWLRDYAARAAADQDGSAE